MQLSLTLPKKYSRRIWRALMEFDMLTASDRILVGLSGGKDSAFLLYALHVLLRTTGFPFELGAACIDAGFTSESYAYRLAELCQAMEVPFFYERHEGLQEIIFDTASSQSPCARCAFFRRGMLNRIARDKGYNKIALGHHLDDAAETFLMSILYSGKIQTFTPVTAQDRSELTVIRPLCLLREKEITGTRSFFPWEPISSCCPKDGASKRSEVKALIRRLGDDSPKLFDRVVSAMRRSTDEIDLWPSPLGAEEMREKYLRMVASLK
ncbi:MAG: tRNA 2-thiocytidine biosynthesis TtcA family protein [Symbiobacteriaceae bacterium]|nr:tRNA 2-thiocytidine biosynthesis TtcA family protein [Symbiobacteriaceae bacterium]